MKTNLFEDFLKEKHAEDYHGTDDNMPDAFEDWIMSLDTADWLNFGEEFGNGQNLKGYNEGKSEDSSL